MQRIHSIASLDDFSLSHDPADHRARITEIWESGECRPDWCFVLRQDTETVGRVCYRASPTVSAPERLGTLPERELSIYGLWLAATGEAESNGHSLLLESLRQLRDQLPDGLELRANPDIHPDAELRRALARGLGLELFQEKQGFVWQANGAPAQLAPDAPDARDAPRRLSPRTIEEIGPDAYRRVLSFAAEETLDRNDAYYRSNMTANGWAAEMMEFLRPEDSGSWLAAFDSADRPVGFVAVSAFDEPSAGTIAHIGVAPEHRGRGYINDLLALAAEAARDRGFDYLLSDVDTLNSPMIAAMLRAGHRTDLRPWHVWAYRGSVAGILARRAPAGTIGR